jgi:parallel beta-helix repeat protein
LKLFQFCKIVTAGSILVLFAVVLCLGTLQEARATQAIEVDMLILQQDTVWENEILVKGDVEVAKGVTLTIMPGTVVKFSKIEKYGPHKLNMDKETYFPRAEIVVRGRLIAQGTKDKMITFTSAEDSPVPSDWGGINFLESTDNILEYCDISYGHTSVHCHSAQVVLSNCYIHHNGVAVGQKNLKGSEIKTITPIMYNRITENGGGILFGGGARPIITHNLISKNKFFAVFGKKSGTCLVRYNDITDNGKGILLYKMNKITIAENNITGNVYNISLMEGQESDVNAPNNWWGTEDEKKIKDLIWDKDEDDTLGRLIFSDRTSSPIEGAGLPRP